MCDTFFWNVRGLNEPSKHRPLADWINSKSITFGALLETHVRESNMNQLLSIICPGWTCISNYQHSFLGKIWIVSKLPTSIVPLFSDLQSITCEVKLEEGQSFIYTAVYASNEVEERKDLWLSLRDSYIAFNLATKPWIVNGDFNEILSPSETSNASIIRSSSGMRGFSDCLAEVGLFDLPSQGPLFTWSNKCPSVPIAKRLDRCLVNDQWLLMFPSSHCTFEPPEFSDHTPCHIKLLTPKPVFGTRPFKFFNFLSKHPLFLQTVKTVWEQAGSRAENLKDFCYKLKGLKRPLKSLCKDNFSGIEKRVLEALSTLKAAQLLALNDPSSSNVFFEQSSRDVWLILRLAEESFFRQRSRIKWLEEGDLNTRFFHFVTQARNASNAIKYLLTGDGSKTSTLQDVHLLAQSYFAGIFCRLKGDYCPFLSVYLDRLIDVRCTSGQQSILSGPFFAEVIKSLLFKMPLNKTPGPDGFRLSSLKLVGKLSVLRLLVLFKIFSILHSCLPVSTQLHLCSFPKEKELKS